MIHFDSKSRQMMTRCVLVAIQFVSAATFLVGVAGAKWITSEVDKRLLKQGVKVAAASAKLPKEQSERIAEGSPRQILRNIKEACEASAPGKAATA